MTKTSDKHRSIGERLRRAKTPEALAATLAAWVDNWERDQIAVLEMIEEGVRTMDPDLLQPGAGQLRALTAKRMQALRNVLALLSGQQGKARQPGS